MTSAPEPSGLPTGWVLAGGRARRFGGIDKGLIELAGRPLASWACERLRPQVDALLLNANRNLDAYAWLGFPVVSDGLPDFPGPLAGVLSGLEKSQSEWLLTVPCDTPFLPADLAARMRSVQSVTGADVVRAQAAGQVHFAVMLLHRGLAADLRASLAAGEHRVQAWQARHRTAEAEFDEAWAFFNINTQADLRLAEAHLQG